MPFLVRPTQGRAGISQVAKQGKQSFLSFVANFQVIELNGSRVLHQKQWF